MPPYTEEDLWQMAAIEAAANHLRAVKDHCQLAQNYAKAAMYSGDVADRKDAMDQVAASLQNALAALRNAQSLL